VALLETEPFDVELDDDGEIRIDGDGLHLVSGLPAVAQLIRIAILLFLGEWFLNLEKGMPWFQEILGQKFDAALIRQRLSERILAVPGVAEILSVAVSFDSESRAVTVDWEVRAAFGGTVAGTTTTTIGGTSG
jgi:hypothetical protein